MSPLSDIFVRLHSLTWQKLLYFLFLKILLASHLKFNFFPPFWLSQWLYFGLRSFHLSSVYYFWDDSGHSVNLRWSHVPSIPFLNLVLSMESRKKSLFFFGKLIYSSRILSLSRSDLSTFIQLFILTKYNWRLVFTFIYNLLTLRTIGN